MKYLKKFENVQQRAFYISKNNIDAICKMLNVKDLYFLCVKSPDKDFYFKFTEGKKYKLYISTVGPRIKDDRNKFFTLYMIETDKMRKDIMDGKIYNIDSLNFMIYAGSIFTTATSIEEYEFFNKTDKFNL